MLLAVLAHGLVLRAVFAESGVWRQRGFDDFRIGTFGNGGQNLYVQAQGTGRYFVILQTGVVVVPQAVEAEVVRRAWQKVHDENTTHDAIRACMKATAAYEKFGVL
jgi:hypothetical protein